MDQQLMLEKFQGDTDGDWYQVKDQEYEGVADNDENITWETQNFRLIYGEAPQVQKLGKEAIPGEIEVVAIRSMDNKTGMISNLVKSYMRNFQRTRDIYAMLCRCTQIVEKLQLAL